MKPIHDYVMVRRIALGERKRGKIWIPDTVEIEDLDKPRVVIVVEVGPQCKEVRPMDKVLIEPGKGMELSYQPDKGRPFDDEVWDCVFVTENAIMCILDCLREDQIGQKSEDKGVDVTVNTDLA